MMILLSSDPRELALRSWLANSVGVTDEQTLTEWLWENHKGSGVEYVDALAAIVSETGKHGPTFIRNLLDFAKKPKEVRELEQEIIRWVKPRIERAATVILGHRGAPAVAQVEFQAFIDDFVAQLRKLFPHAHRASVHGAIVTCCKHENGSISVDVAQVVKALRMKDPLADTARASWS